MVQKERTMKMICNYAKRNKLVERAILRVINRNKDDPAVAVLRFKVYPAVKVPLQRISRPDITPH